MIDSDSDSDPDAERYRGYLQPAIDNRLEASAASPKVNCQSSIVNKKMPISPSLKKAFGVSSLAIEQISE